MTELPTIPLWRSVLDIIGFSSLIGAALGHWLGSRRERLKWVNDNKKAEWRELIDELDKSFSQMIYAFQRINLISSMTAITL